MKLTRLDAWFFGNVQLERKSSSRVASIDGAQGIYFQCPKCAEGKPVTPEENGIRGFMGAHYVKVCFSNPRNADVAPHEYDDNPRWHMSGSSLDDLTLSPSINLDVPENAGGCGWHGFVINGDAS